MQETNITVIDSMMGSGKTTFAIRELIDKNLDENILYVTPYLEQIERIKSETSRKIYDPQNRGKGKIDSIAYLLSNQYDIAATHELFRRFDDNCKQALMKNDYTLILDETLTAVEQFKFDKPDDYIYLLKNKDISVADNGLIVWTGDDELDTRFSDVRILSKNHCLFRVDEKFFIWHFPVEIFKLFKKIYVLTYLFDGSIMKYYFDLYGLQYETKSIKRVGDTCQLCDYYVPELSDYRKRFNIYDGADLLKNISQKPNALSSTWFKSANNKDDIKHLKNNIYNYCRNKINVRSKDIMWTTFKSSRAKLTGKGYAKGFVSCNCRATNDYTDKACLIYALNWYVHPEIYKFFAKNGIEIDQDKVALADMVQWVWRSNIRVSESDKIVHIYIPSQRMRDIFTGWLRG